MTNLIIQKVQTINNFPNLVNVTPPRQLPPRNVNSKPPENVKTSEKHNPGFLSKHHDIAVVGFAVAGSAMIFALEQGVKLRKFPRYAVHIDFVEAKTMEEAVSFAKKHFRTVLELGDNLDFANYVNKNLVKINNKMRGRAQMPNFVKFSEKDNDTFWGSWLHYTKTLTIGSDLRDLVKVLKNKNIHIEEYLERAIKRGGAEGQRAREIETTIPHEIGHATHFTYCPKANYMHSLENLEKLGLDKTLTEQFLEDIKHVKGLEGLYSDYLLSCPVEFVAETFAYKILGRSLHPDIENLYIKYKGPEVPKLLDLAA